MAHGSPFCPLIRLYRFTENEARDLRSRVDELARGRRISVALHELDFITPVFGCELVLIVADEDRGILASKTSDVYSCVLTKERWEVISVLISPYCVPRRSNDHKWLDRTSDISLLLAPTSKI